MADITADKFETVKAGDGFALAVARIEGPVQGFAVTGAQKVPVRQGDQVVSPQGQTLFPVPAQG